MQEKFTLFCRSGTMSFQYDDRILPILQRFKLEHVGRLGSIRIDRDLIFAAVERWRRETHSFHMPIGEISITLEDVSGLWGLPINGNAVTGFTDDHWHEDVVECFGRDEDDWTMYRRPPGTYHMRAEWLREPWVDPNQRNRAILSEDANEVEIQRYN